MYSIPIVFLIVNALLLENTSTIFDSYSLCKHFMKDDADEADLTICQEKCRYNISKQVTLSWCSKVTGYCKMV